MTTAIVLWGGALLLGAAPASDASPMPPNIPETPAGQRLKQWLEAFNTGNRDSWRSFYESAFSAEALVEHPLTARLDSLQNLFSGTQGLELVHVHEDTDDKLSAVVRGRGSEDFLELGVQLVAGDTHRIQRITVQPVPAPRAFRTAAPFSKSRLSRELDAYLRRLTERGLFSGAVLVAREDQILFRKAYGLAHRGWGVPNRPGTKFNLGSMNKMVTAIAVAQLVERGDISFQDTVGKILSEWPNKPVSDKVTVHHLLTHTSGMGSYFNESFMQSSRDRYRAVKDYEPLYVHEPLAFEPGERWEYSNSGFMLLGAIVEKVSGQDYFDYVRTHITGPAGMKNTDCYELDLDVPGIATGYTRTGRDTTLRTNTFLHVIKGGPAGGGYSTVDDILRFSLALRSGKLVRPDTVQTLFAPHAATSHGSHYGYGMNVETVDGCTVVGHAGGFPGLNSQLDMILEDGLTVVVMCNLDPPAAQRVAQRIREWLIPMKEG